MKVQVLLALFIWMMPFWGVGCRSMPVNRMVDLQLTITGSNLLVEVTNTSNAEVRFWNENTSWGWFCFQILITNSHGEDRVLITRNNRDWTKNGPDYFSVASGMKQEFILNLFDGWWEIPEYVENLRHEDVVVQIIYEVLPTKESDKFNIFVSKQYSNEITLSPPYHWLPYSIKNK